MNRRASRAVAADSCPTTDTVSPYSDILNEDVAFQSEILPLVSRTFALTIPQLPEPLCLAVSNAYLLCRIADTIEDDVALTARQKHRFHDVFTAVVGNQASSESFAGQLYPLLSDRTLQAERELVKRTPEIVRITQALNVRQRTALQRCVRIMCDGMPRFQRNKSLSGLKDQHELDEYCYFVAGVVGEMLTELFCDYSDEIAEHHDEMMRLSVSFGQGLQMTNILKDIWDDQQRAMCWLPANLFEEAGYDTNNIKHQLRDEHFVAGLQQLIKLANAHLQNALSYTLTIPDRHVGIRRFCLWALGMAVMTLRKINKHPDFESSQQVKISRRMVKWVVGVSNTLTRRDGSLQALYRWFSKALDQSPADIRSLLPDYSIISQWHQPVEIIPALAIDRQAS